jgi:hypothetical protein
VSHMRNTAAANTLVALLAIARVRVRADLVADAPQAGIAVVKTIGTRAGSGVERRGHGGSGRGTGSRR